eukprot:761392-Hanusia_phi.AAC.3
MLTGQVLLQVVVFAAGHAVDYVLAGLDQVPSFPSKQPVLLLADASLMVQREVSEVFPQKLEIGLVLPLQKGVSLLFKYFGPLAQAPQTSHPTVAEEAQLGVGGSGGPNQEVTEPLVQEGAVFHQHRAVLTHVHTHNVLHESAVTSLHRRRPHSLESASVQQACEGNFAGVQGDSRLLYRHQPVARPQTVLARLALIRVTRDSSYETPRNVHDGVSLASKHLHPRGLELAHAHLPAASIEQQEFSRVHDECAILEDQILHRARATGVKVPLTIQHSAIASHMHLSSCPRFHAELADLIATSPQPWVHAPPVPHVATFPHPHPFVAA